MLVKITYPLVCTQAPENYRAGEYKFEADTHGREIYVDTDHLIHLTKLQIKDNPARDLARLANLGHKNAIVYRGYVTVFQLQLTNHERIYFTNPDVFHCVEGLFKIKRSKTTY